MTEISGSLKNQPSLGQSLPSSGYGFENKLGTLLQNPTRTLVGSARIRSTNAIEASQAEAISTENFIFKNFNQPFLTTRSAADTNSVVSSEDEVLAIATGDAFFIFDPAIGAEIGVGSITTEATGRGTDFEGVAESFASVAGTFFIRAGETFSFEFSGYLQMNTSLQDAETQTANTTGRIAFGVYDFTHEPTRLDFLEVTGGLDTPGDLDFLSFQTSGSSIDLNPQQTRFARQSGKLAESGFVSIFGDYQTQPFTQDTLLVLGDLGIGSEPTSDGSESDSAELVESVSWGTV
jgi:hypothetical protein